MTMTPQPAGQPNMPIWTDLTLQDISATPSMTTTGALVVLVQDVLIGHPDAESKFTSLFYPLVKKTAYRKAQLLRDTKTDISFASDDLAHWAWLYIVNGQRIDSHYTYHQHTSPLAKWLNNQSVSLLVYIVSLVALYLKDVRKTMVRGGGPLLFPATDIDGLAADEHESTSIQDCFKQLREGERQIIDLLFYVGLTQAQAAAQLGIHPASFSRRYLAVKKALKACLENA